MQWPAEWWCNKYACAVMYRFRNYLLPAYADDLVALNVGFIVAVVVFVVVVVVVALVAFAVAIVAADAG